MTSREDYETYMKEAARSQAWWANAKFIAGLAASLVLAIIGFVIYANLVSAGEGRVEAALRASGLHDAKIGGSNAFACAAGESSRHFEATNESGKLVKGTVCCGITGAGRGCAIRW